MEQGPVEARIIEQAKANKMPLPDKIANAPSLQAGLQFYHRAFNDLHSCRSGGMSEGYIPWTAVLVYSKQYALDSDEFERLLTLVRRMDLEYLKHREKKLKRK